MFLRHRHTLRTALLAQPIDVLQLTPMLDRIRALEDAAVPVLRYSQFMDPTQTVLLLARLPRLVGKERNLNADQERMRELVLQRLSNRFSELAEHCSNEQLVRGLTGLGRAR